MKFVDEHNVSKCRIRGERTEYQGRMKRLARSIMNLEMPTESVGTLAGAQSWRARVLNFRMRQRSYEQCCRCERNGEQIGIGGR